MMQPIDSQVVAAALKQLGNVAAVGMMSSASKDRVRKTPQIHAQPMKSSLGIYQNDGVPHYGQGSQSSSNIQAKRNSKLIMSSNQNVGANNLGINLNQIINKRLNQIHLDDYQPQVKSATAEKRRNFKSSTKTTVENHHTPNLQAYYHPTVTSSGIFHQQKRRVSSTSTGGGAIDSQSLDHFHNHLIMNTTGDPKIHNFENDDEDVLRVEDYNNQTSQQYFTQQHRTGPSALRMPSGFDDTEGDYYPRQTSTSTISKKKRYNRLENNNDYQNLDEDVRVPAFLIGRGSLENNNRDKGQFYMTQVLSQSNTKVQQSSAKNTSQSSTLKTNKSAKLKSASKKQTSVTSSSALAKQYALSTMKNLTTQQRLALLAGVGSSQQLESNDGGFHLSSQEFTRQQSAQKRTSTIMMSQTGLIQNANEGFFNSTAPINMQKINSGVGFEGCQQIKDLDKSKESTSIPRQHSYYHSGSNLLKTSAAKKKPTTLNNTHLDQSASLSPLKHVPSVRPSGVTGKKQMLIQSLLNTKPDQQPKALLNLTLQNLIQQQQSKNIGASQEFQSKMVGNHRGLLSHNRLNKTLDTSGEINKNQGIRGQSATRGSTQKYGNKSKQSKMSSTMRISDFNQTQQIQEIKGQIQEEGGRKSKVSLKTTQQMQLNQEEGAEQRKQSVLSIYNQNVQQQNQNKTQKRPKLNQTQKTHQKKPSNEHHNYDQNERDMLKKMMNFYQDDFLSHFNLKNPTQVDVPKVISKPGGQKTALSKQQSDKGVGNSQTKHKAHTTLNHYLQQNQQVMRFEPQILMQTPGSPDIESQEIVLGQRKKDHLKEFQNKTQPIPKNILEMGAQTGIGANVSTGTNGMGNVVKGHGSIESEVVIVQQPKQEPPKQLVAQSKPLEKQQQKVNPKQKQEDPAEIYANKRQQILEDDLIPHSSLEDQNISNQTDRQDSDSDEESDDGNRKLAKFVLGKQVGQGAYAVVRIASLKSDPTKKFAIKVYDKSKLTDINRQRSVRREIKLLQKMNHPNIVKIFEAFETDDNVYLVMEYVGGGSLHSYLKEKADRRLDEEDAKRIFKQIMTALQYCHRKSIAHRDIKLENILLDDNNNVKLIDFGFSTCIPNDKKIKMFCGTPSYMAPEIVMKEEYAGPPADIWASAVLLYALLNGCFPYRGATDKELYRRIQRGTFVLHNPTVSDSFTALLTRMLNVVADDRPTAEDILEDPWFTIQSTSQPRRDQTRADIMGVAIEQAARAEQARAEERRAFKAKILGKISIERGEGAICINGQDRVKGPVQISGSGTVASNVNPINNNTNYQPNQNNTDFSDYGLQQQNVIKKLNQEAYQAYYNTSGANFGLSGSGTIQNPYYNNFFQNTPFVNQPQLQQPNLGFYPGVFNSGPNPQQRGSPSKNPGLGQQNPQPAQGPFANYSAQPPQLNALGAHQPTPQVFQSPNSPPPFHCNGGMINNNFNIINNIIMNPHQAGVSSPPPQGANQQQETVKSPQPYQEDMISPGNIMIIEPEKDDEIEDEDELDEEIVGSMEKLGFNRSQIVTDILKDKNPNTHVGQIYTRMKEEKLSKTSKHRANSMQPHRQRMIHAINKHNNPIFPKNFIPSIADDSSSFNRKFEGGDFEGTQKIPFHKYKNAYYDDATSAQNDDYNIMLLSGQKSPKASRFNQTQQYQLFPIMQNPRTLIKEPQISGSGIIGQKY